MPPGADAAGPEAYNWGFPSVQEADKTMTMLDRMRRHKGWLKWSLAIVILAFIILYIPSFLRPDAAGNSDVVASVEGREITVGRFRQAAR